MPQMGRRRQHDLNLPPHVYLKRGRYYYGRQGIALGPDFPAALRKYAELHGGTAVPGTFSEAVRLYTKTELGTKARKTQEEYTRQLATLVKVFGRMPLDAIRTMHVKQFMEKRPAIAGTREKALLSAVFNHAKGKGLTDAPNPCVGVRGTKSVRGRYVTDAELAHVLAHADPTLAGFLELCYRTGQRPGDVTRIRWQDVRDGALWVQQGKTGAKVRIRLTDTLQGLLVSLRGHPVASLYVIRDGRGQRLTLAALRKRFDRLGLGHDWNIQDLRAKAASDSPSIHAAKLLLGHAAETTTDGYRRDISGELAEPIDRAIIEVEKKERQGR